MAWRAGRASPPVGSRVGFGEPNEVAQRMRRWKYPPGLLPIAIHLFSGPRRPGDLQSCLVAELDAHGVDVRCISFDVELGPEGDLRRVEAWHRLRRWASLGLVVVVHAGTLCSTSSSVRFVPGGPRPLRSRDCVSGIPNLTPKLRRRCDEGTMFVERTCSLFSFFGLDGVASLEHTED